MAFSAIIDKTIKCAGFKPMSQEQLDRKLKSRQPLSEVDICRLFNISLKTLEDVWLPTLLQILDEAVTADSSDSILSWSLETPLPTAWMMDLDSGVCVDLNKLVEQLPDLQKIEAVYGQPSRVRCEDTALGTAMIFPVTKTLLNYVEILERLLKFGRAVQERQREIAAEMAELAVTEGMERLGLDHSTTEPVFSLENFHL